MWPLFLLSMAMYSLEMISARLMVQIVLSSATTLEMEYAKGEYSEPSCHCLACDILQIGIGS